MDRLISDRSRFVRYCAILCDIVIKIIRESLAKMKNKKILEKIAKWLTSVDAHFSARLSGGDDTDIRPKDCYL